MLHEEIPIPRILRALWTEARRANDEFLAEFVVESVYVLLWTEGLYKALGAIANSRQLLHGTTDPRSAHSETRHP